MAYDAELADRIRALTRSEPGLSERKMFGGLAFLVDGNMAVAASGQGGVLVRVDPDQSDELVSTSPASAMEMRGRPMAGWLRVDSHARRGRARACRLGRARHLVCPLVAAEAIGRATTGTRRVRRRSPAWPTVALCVCTIGTAVGQSACAGCSERSKRRMS